MTKKEAARIYDEEVRKAERAFYRAIRPFRSRLTGAALEAQEDRLARRCFDRCNAAFAAYDAVPQ